MPQSSLNVFCARLGDTEVYTYHNWQNASEKQSEKFKVPSVDILNALKKDDRVKISNGYERFWVQIVNVLKEKDKVVEAFAINTTRLVNDYPYNYGSYLFLKPENIFEVIPFEIFDQHVQEYKQKYTKEQLKEKLDNMEKFKIVNHDEN